MWKLSEVLVIAACGAVVAINASGQTSAGPDVGAALEAEIQTTFVLKGGMAVTSPGHYYRSHDGKLREDSGIGATIVDTTTGTMTFLNSSAMEAVVISGAVSKLPVSPPDPTKAHFVPFEATTIDGHPVTKARTVDQTREVWTATDIGLAVLVQVSSPDLTSRKVLSNISIHEPDSALFQVPQGYKITAQAAPSMPPAAPTLPFRPETQQPGAPQPLRK